MLDSDDPITKQLVMREEMFDLLWTLDEVSMSDGGRLVAQAFCLWKRFFASEVMSSHFSASLQRVADNQIHFNANDLVTKLSTLRVKPRRERSISADLWLEDIAVLKNLDKEWISLRSQLRNCEILQKSILKEIGNELGDEES